MICVPTFTNRLFLILFLQHDCNFRVRIQFFEKAVHIDAAKAARKGQVIFWRNILPPYCNDRMIDKGLIDRLKLLIFLMSAPMISAPRLPVRGEYPS